MRRLLPIVAVVVLGSVVALAQPPTGGPVITHRDGFAAREPAWVPVDANVKYVEKDHRVATDRYFTAPSSEYLKIEANPPAGSPTVEYVYYAYDTPPAAVTEATSARVRVRAFRAGIRLYARVVLPKERDPKNPDTLMTTLIPGEVYPEDRVRYWHELKITDPAAILRKQLPVLTALLGHQADDAGAYIDRLVLNVYAGPGATEVWIDDLEIGPCRVDPSRPVGRLATPTAKSTPRAHPFAVEFAGGKILIDKKPFFMRAIRHTDTGPDGLQRLREAKFNAVYLPADADPKLIDEAVTKHQFFVIPGVPLAPAEIPVNTNGLDREADRMADHFRRFRSGDGVLMWDLGGGRTTEQVRSVARTADIIREFDPRRPRAVDVWDGYQAYSEHLDAIGTHRWPLFTSLQLEHYREWLAQRKALTGHGKLLWTWVQTHMPDWYVSLATRGLNAVPPQELLPPPEQLDRPFGPTPAQIRLLTYLGVASGCRGLGFWSDRYLANSHFGRDRLLELFLLNCELELLEPVLFGVEDEKTEWIDTSHPHVRAAVLRGRKGVIVLPMWIGPGSQYVPAQGALEQLKIKVEQVPDGADPWLLTAASYTNLRNSGGVKDVPPGVEITIPQFDLTAAIVFTTDNSSDGLVVRWQENIRHQFGPTAARYAMEAAKEEYNKVLTVHELLAPIAPPVSGADKLLEESRTFSRQAQRYLDNNQPDLAYREARRASHPLRVLMRDHWEAAVKTLDEPTASPYAVSYFTLPQHWELAKRMQPPAQFGPNALPHGGFELAGPLPAGGAAVQSLPGWKVRQSTLDAVTMRAAIDPVAAIAGKKWEANPEPPVPSGTRTIPPPARVGAARKPAPGPGPESGSHALVLKVLPKDLPPDPKTGKPVDTPFPGALERSFLGVDSPPVSFAPGTWVRISFWVRVLAVIAAPDGAMVYDTAGGEALGVRIYETNEVGTVPPKPLWKQYHLYRQVPASGTIGLTFALTGCGIVGFDDVRIEAME